MQISIDWLRQYLPAAPTAHPCADALTMAGLPTENFSQFESDTVMDVELTSNRGDCLSHLGVARELGALLNLPVSEPEIPSLKPSDSHSAPLVAIDDLNLCPFYSALIIRNVKVGPSPAWLQTRLKSIGLRPINNVVDVTNFVLMELGQPMHAFDLAKLAHPPSGQPMIRVRNAAKGEKITTIDGHERALSPDMLVIADSSGPVAIAGVMGGKLSEVTEATTDILLESAIFEPLCVRKTSRTLRLRSDSSHRYERGIPLHLPPIATARAAQLILQTAGGSVPAPVGFVGSSTPPTKSITLRKSALSRTLGIDIPLDQAASALKRLRCNVTPSPDAIVVTPPADRLDLNVEIDLVEEVARVIGYQAIPLRDDISIRLTPPDSTAKSMSLIKAVLTSAGYFEAITFSFITDALRSAMLPPQAAFLPTANPHVRKADSSLRPSLIPGLLEAVRRNQSAGTSPIRLFEVGSAFHIDAQKNWHETRKLTLVTDEDPRILRGVIDALLTRLDPRRAISASPTASASAPGYFRQAALTWGDHPVGVIGVVSPSVLQLADVRGSVSAAELDLLPLIQHTRHVPTLQPLPKFPAIERDLSLVVDDAVRYAAIETLVSSLDLPNFRSLTHVTTYKGQPLEKGKKSVTVKLEFRSDTGSLASDQIDPLMDKLIVTAAEKLSATIRT